jgi:hypothetical protein
MRVILPVLLALSAAARLGASGAIGIYGIVEKVVVEPNERSPERIQVWGAFAYADRGERGYSPVKRGYLYFRLPAPDVASRQDVDLVLKEWNDLKSVAGTGQAIGFGSWGYIGRFEGLRPDARGVGRLPYLLERAPHGGAHTDLRVRPQAEAPAGPASYQTNAGIVRLSDRGSHAEIVKRLKEGLSR